MKTAGNTVNETVPSGNQLSSVGTYAGSCATGAIYEGGINAVAGGAAAVASGGLLAPAAVAGAVEGGVYGCAFGLASQALEDVVGPYGGAAGTIAGYAHDVTDLF